MACSSTNIGEPNRYKELMIINNRLYKILFSGLCLTGLFASCSGKQKKKPYSPIEGDTIDVVIGEFKRRTVSEAIEESFGKGTPQDSAHRELRRVIEKKYQVMGDSLMRKVLRGNHIH